MDLFNTIANGPLMFILCGMVIIFVIFQSLLFMVRAWQRGKELGIQTSQMKKSIMSSAIFSIVPSLPIVVVLLTLMESLGKYFPWLRLSVVGSGFYEGMAAELTAKTYGFDGISALKEHPAIFVSAMWIMTIAILWGNLFNVIGLEKLDRGLKKVRDKKPVLFGLIVNGMFLAILAYLSAPYVTNIGNMAGVVAFIVASISALIFNFIAKKLNNRAIGEFSFAVSMILGMLSTFLVNSI